MSQSNPVENSNVVSMFGRRKQTPEPVVAEALAVSGSDTSADTENLEDSMRRNRDLAEKMRQDRLKSNQQVIKNFKLKN